jgi:uncharacterized membrane protein
LIVRKAAATALLFFSTVWCLSIVAPPVFGWQWVYRFFSAICHQDPERSWHILGVALPVCIRCTSIYVAFTASLWIGIRANATWLRISLVFLFIEFLIARMLIDAAVLRSIAGILFGLSAAPFVKQGVEELGDLL